LGLYEERTGTDLRCTTSRVLLAQKNNDLCRYPGTGTSTKASDARHKILNFISGYSQTRVVTVLLVIADPKTRDESTVLSCKTRK
jgi:hypothetical protein